MGDEEVVTLEVFAETEVVELDWELIEVLDSPDTGDRMLEMMPGIKPVVVDVVDVVAGVLLSFAAAGVVGVVGVVGSTIGCNTDTTGPALPG